ncbi:MAG: 4Fe-4S binding protein, partial [Chloroflexi bacterium]|nr:4Fe-4S binding protein [Chloroflexota bacterium]
MIGFLEGLIVTLKTTFRRPVTTQYPDPKKRQQVAYRYMGFPALLWDNEVAEPYCTGCMVCIRECPTQCMSAQMMDNPQFEAGDSRRRKIINEFEINLGRCILCGICVDVCNFDAIEMSHEHELSKYQRNSNRVDLPQLLEMGKEFQVKTSWRPTQPEKNSGVPAKREAAVESPVATATTATIVAAPASGSKEDRLAAARARAAAKRETADTGEASADAVASEAPAQAMSKEDRLAAARAKAAAKRDTATAETSEASV